MTAVSFENDVVTNSDYRISKQSFIAPLIVVHRIAYLTKRAF